MRVLVVTNRYPPDSVGGYEESCKDTVDELRGRGHAVTVLTRRGRDATKASEPWVRRKLHYRRAGNRSLVLSGPLLDLSDCRESARALTATYPDVVYLWNPVGLSMLALARLLRALPAVCYVAYYWYEQLMLGETLPDQYIHQVRELSTRPVLGLPMLDDATNALAKWLFDWRSSKRIWCRPSVCEFDSSYLLESARQKGIVGPHDRVVPHGLQDWWYHASQRPSGNGLRLLFVGRVSPEKGIENALQALKLVRRVRPDTTLTVVGHAEARYKHRFRALVADPAVNEAVHVLGKIPREDLVSLYRSHDVFLFLSEFEEPFGMVLVEAMACSIPIVSTCLGGAGHVAPVDKACVSTEPGDPVQLAEAVLKLASDELLRRSLTEQGKVLAESFRIRRVVNDIESDLEMAVALAAREGRRSISKSKSPSSVDDEAE